MRRTFWFLMVCLFFLPVNYLRSETIEDMQTLASDLLKSNKPEEALKLHEQVVSIDSTNLESNTWLGNYYFLQGKELVSVSEKKYQAIHEATRMQTAIYMEELKSIYNNYFLNAEPYLRKSYELRKNDYVLSLIETIDLFKIRIGIRIPQERKEKRKLIKDQTAPL